MIEIKVLGANDASILMNVAPGVFDNPVDLRATDEFLRDRRHHLAVAVEDGVVVGFVSALHYIHPDKPRPELWINEVGVAPTHQERGLGKKLLHSILELAQRFGCAEAWVLTDRSNFPATRLYSSMDGAEPKDQSMFTFHLNIRP